MEDFSAISIALPAFLVVLREGIEAALIVGIIAGFLRQTGRQQLMKYVILGVIVGAVLCAGVGYVMFKHIGTIRQREQELVVGIVGLVAVGLLTYMVFWLKNAVPSLKEKLRSKLTTQIGEKRESVMLIFMAFLAVVREGLEVIFILIGIISQTFGKPKLIAYQNAYVVGSSLGLLVAIFVGYAIYQGAARINLGKFFRWTGAFLILVAAGLFIGSFRALHEAGVWNLFQQQIMLCNKNSLMTAIVSISVLFALFCIAAAGCYFFLRRNNEAVKIRQISTYIAICIAIAAILVFCYSLRIFPDFETMYAELPNCINMQKVLPEDDSFIGVMLSGFFGYTDRPVLSDLILYFVYLIPAVIFFFTNNGKKEK
ncbi:MAG: FTR1 family protein [Cardiobacteriaceae bacterium]|nr:FTR1 family protein [Cardiobacteriaceae bacterium]